MAKFAVILITISLIDLGASATPPPGQFWSSLRRLASNSQKEAEKCDLALKSLIKKAGEPQSTSQETIENAYLRSKKMATEILLGLNNLPEGITSANEGFLLIRDTLPNGPPADLAALFQIRRCNPVQGFKLYKWLIHSVKHFSFSEKERRSIRTSTIRYVNHDLDGALTLIELMIRITLIKELKDNGLLALSETQNKTLAAIRHIADQLKMKTKQRWTGSFDEDRIKDLSPQKQMELAFTVQAELKQCQPIQKNLANLIAGLAD